VQHTGLVSGNRGTEKVCCFVANKLVERGHDVEMATMEDVEGLPVFPLDERVRVRNLFSPAIPHLDIRPISRYQGWNPIKKLYSKYNREKAKAHNRMIYEENGGERGVFEQNLRKRSKVWHDYITELGPDVVVAVSPYTLLDITFERTYQIPIVVSVHGRPDYDYTNILWERPKYVLDSLIEAYGHASGFHVLLNSYKNFLPETFAGNVFVIENFMPQFPSETVVRHSNSKATCKIVNTSALSIDHKQQNVAIDIFSRIAEKHPKWELHFWGTGADESTLGKKIEDRIFLNGFTADPMEKLKEADIFLFPSRFEGFPLALTEAMSVGLPSIGFAACSGVNELIAHGKNGFLAKDHADMRELLEKLMAGHELRNQMGRQANRDMQQYHPERIADKWEGMIKFFGK